MALYKPEKRMIKEYPGLFAITGLFILIGLISTISASKHFVAPLVAWVIFLVASAALAYFTFYFCYRDETASADGSGRRDIGKGFFIAAVFFYALIVFGSAFAARTQRVDACIPSETLALTGQPGQGQAWVDYYSNCPTFDRLLDEPAQQWIIRNNDLPEWLMFRNGITGDPVGWWNFYSTIPAEENPYDLSKIDKNTFFKTRQLPEEAIK